MKSVLLLSGGVDSTVALAHVINKGIEVPLTLSFNYGQTHIRELSAARQIAKHYGVEHHELDLSRVLDTPSALTFNGSIPTGHAESPDATFVPGRNLVLIAVATAWANAWGYDTVVLGANADDQAGYPDCRFEFSEALDRSMRAGYGVGLWTPFLRLTKKQIVEKGLRLGVPLDMTWSCYRGLSSPCDNCGACESRKVAGL